MRDHSDGDEKQPAWVDRLQTITKSSHWHVTSTRWQVARETAAVNYLTTMLDSDRFLPPIGGWSMDYSVVAAVLDGVRHMEKEVMMVELGSGAGTPWLASIARQSGGHLISIEHDPEFVTRTRALIDYYQLQDSCTVVLAELTGDWDGTPWYDLPVIESAIGSCQVDVLIIDGPPASIGAHSRQPALFALQNVLAEGALVVLDDVVREEEQQTLAAWQQAFDDRLQVIPLLDKATMLRLDMPRHEKAQPHHTAPGTAESGAGTSVKEVQSGSGTL